MKRIFFPARGIAALALGMSVSACASLSGLDGSTEYGCKAPQGVQCDSVSGNYYNALQDNLPNQRRRRLPGIADSTRAAARLPTAADNPPSIAPLRSQARVLRLWFKPWEDADHDLVDQGFVYVQIDNGRWLIDHAQQRIRDAYAPIHPPHSAAQPADAALRPPGAPGNDSGPSAAALEPQSGQTNFPGGGQ